MKLFFSLFSEKTNCAKTEERRAERSLFVQQLLMSSICKSDTSNSNFASTFPPAIRMKSLLETRPKTTTKEVGSGIEPE